MPTSPEVTKAVEAIKADPSISNHLALAHALGLDRRYDDIIEPVDAEGNDLAAMSRGYHYNYRTQEWVEGHDHAHYATGDESLPLLFCGSDVTTCCGISASVTA